MSQDKYGAELVLCPFFKEATGRSLRCEGAMDGSTVTQFFRRSEDKLAYKRIYCDTWQHKACAIYAVANGKYDEHGKVMAFQPPII
ncbi:MAG: hypothetical protein MJ075_07490 [Oscillospiraceae bacterium]|nr:hypothetical protein [Oscillospiraceae bacterium]